MCVYRNVQTAANTWFENPPKLAASKTSAPSGGSKGYNQANADAMYNKYLK